MNRVVVVTYTNTNSVFVFKRKNWKIYVYIQRCGSSVSVRIISKYYSNLILYKPHERRKHFLYFRF